MTPARIIRLSGYSASGKTTLIEKALPELKRQGLYVGVIKHTHHTLTGIDSEGKDTSRFYKAGADVVAGHDDRQLFVRHQSEDADIETVLGKLPSGLDIVIIEGYKGSDMPGVWLEKGCGQAAMTENAKTGMPAGDKIIYRDDPRYVDIFLQHVHDELMHHHAERAVMGGLLIGGKSIRMGRPKGLLEMDGITIMQRSFNILSKITERTVLLGSADLPQSLRSVGRFPDSRGLEGPIAGMLSAFRWASDCAWIISSVDMPLMNEDAWKWLLDQRRPGVWAVVPRIEGEERSEMTAACYEPMLFDHIESLGRKGVRRLQMIADHPKVLKPVIPKELEDCWRNINTPEQWDEVKGLLI